MLRHTFLVKHPTRGAQVFGRRQATTMVALTITTALALVGCSGASPSEGQKGGNTPATWQGSANDAGNGDSVSVGTWEGKPAAVKITCSGPEGHVTAAVEAPGGWRATTTQPQGGGDAGVKIEGPGNKSVEVKPHGDAAVQWGVAPTFGTAFGLEDAGTGLKFSARAVSCARG